jgi:hypothetical protein
MILSSDYNYYLSADLGCAGSDVVQKLRELGFDIPPETTFIPWDVPFIDYGNG